MGWLEVNTLVFILFYLIQLEKNQSCLFNHARFCSWNQPVLSNEDRVSCSMKQQEPLMGFQTHDWHAFHKLWVRHANHCPMLSLANHCPMLSLEIGSTVRTNELWGFKSFDEGNSCTITGFQSRSCKAFLCTNRVRLPRALTGFQTHI